jgi:exodeoxyribonuclease VII large subunit
VTLAQLEHRLATAQARLRHPGDRLRENAQRLDSRELRLHGAVRARLRDQQQRLALCRQRLAAASPAGQFAGRRMRLEQQQARLQVAVNARLRELHGSIEQNRARLESLSPRAVLSRGYAIVSNASGKVLTDPADVADRERLSVRLAAGSLSVRAEKSVRTGKRARAGKREDGAG